MVTSPLKGVLLLLRSACWVLAQVHFVLFGKKEMAAWVEAAESLLADPTDA